MARATRTQRAAARRRYRTEQAIGTFEDDADSESIERAPPETPRPGTTTSARRGFAAAFREAFRPVNVPEDLRSIPVVVVSASRHLDERTAGMQAAAVVPKPFDVQGG